jgi:O-acetyl-ADP-ribose deacetylase (regulator of RNase III)
MRARVDMERLRGLVALDEPFVAPEPATEREHEALVDALVGYFERDGAHLGEMPEGARARLRTLLTIRPPDPLPEEILAALDRVLQHERIAKGLVEASDLPRFALPNSDAGEVCGLWQGDITRLRVDAIVNAANSELLGCFRPFHPCIDNAIHSAAGPRLREDCAKIIRHQGDREPTGTAKATRGYNLPARFVLHTVGPIVRVRPSPQHEAQLASVYDACLDAALEIGADSIAFCAVSTGVFGFPRDPAAAIAVRTVRAWLERHRGALDLVLLNVFADEDRAAYERALGKERA